MNASVPWLLTTGYDERASARASIQSFVACLCAVSVAKLTQSQHDAGAWFVILSTILMITVLREGLWVALYNSVVVGFFFDFFFTSHLDELRFAAADLRTEALFLVSGLASWFFGQEVRRRRGRVRLRATGEGETGPENRFDSRHPGWRPPEGSRAGAGSP